MSDKEFIEFLLNLLIVSIQCGDQWYPSKDEMLALHDEMIRRNMDTKLVDGL